MSLLRRIAKKFNKPALTQELASSMLFKAMETDDGEEVLRVAQQRPDSVYWPGFGDDPEQVKALIPFDYALRYAKTASAAGMAAAVPELLTDANAKGQTRLFLEVLNFDEKSSAVEILVKVGADTRHTDAEGNSLLHAAATVKGSLKPAKLALDALKNPDLRNSKGETPLMTAAATGAANVAMMLLNKNAEINATDKKGLNATMHGILTGHAQVALVLMLVGGEVDFNHSETAPEKLRKRFAGMPAFLSEIEKQRKSLAERQRAEAQAKNAAHRAALNDAIVTSVGSGVGEVAAPGRAAFRKKKQPSRET